VTSMSGALLMYLLCRWDHLPSEVLSLVAARLHVDDPDAGPAETSSKPAGEAAFVLGPLDENDNADNDGRAEQVSSSSALAALRLVCQGWRSSIDHSLDILIFSRSVPSSVTCGVRYITCCIHAFGHDTSSCTHCKGVWQGCFLVLP
jgi:hypothetical protein